MADLNWLGAGLGAIGAAAGGAFTWLAARHKGKSDMLSSQAAMVRAAQDAATEVIATLQDQIKSLKQDLTDANDRIDKLEAKLDAEKKARSDERHGLANKATVAEKRARDAEVRAVAAEARAAEMEAKCVQADGERRDLQQQLDSLTRRMIAEGVSLPEPPLRQTEPVVLGDSST